MPWIIQWCPMRFASRYSHRQRMSSPMRESCIIIMSLQMSIRYAAAVFGLCGWLRGTPSPLRRPLHFRCATPACPGVYLGILRIPFVLR